MEDGPKHTLVLYNCRVPQTGEVGFTAANAKCSANLKVKGEPLLPRYHLELLELEDSFLEAPRVCLMASSSALLFVSTRSAL